MIDRPERLEQLPTNQHHARVWKFRRDLIIYVARQHGVSERVLADVFDLPTSRIAEIMIEFKDYVL